LGSFARRRPRSKVYGVGLLTTTGSLDLVSVSAIATNYQEVWSLKTLWNCSLLQKLIEKLIIELFESGPLFSGRILARMRNVQPDIFNTHQNVQLTSIVITMASNNCWKCLLRPSVTSNAIGNASSRLPLLAPFSTSSALGLPPPKKPATGLKKGPEKAAKTLRIKKKAFVKTGRPPAPGERKAMRKRIVLSNTNALEVETMQDLDATLIHDAANIGKVMGLPGTVVDQLRAVEAFKTTQGWGMFRRPGMLIREETVQIADAMKAAQVQKNTAVTIIDGERGTGKSMMLLQAMTTAFLKSWIVVNIPEGKSPILRIQNMPLTREQPKI